MRRDLHQIDTLIGSAARLQGDMAFAGGLHVDGRSIDKTYLPSSLIGAGGELAFQPAEFLLASPLRRGLRWRPGRLRPGRR